MTDIRHGSCLCGEIKFHVTGPLRQVIYCHCTQCRKQTGHIVAATEADDGDLTVDGTNHLTWFGSSETAKRGFCSRCGSLLFWKSQQSSTTSIMAGGFEPGSGLQQGHHIYCDDKGEYYQITDGLDQFAQER